MYLRLIKDKVQELSKDIGSAIEVDVTVTDENLIRVGGTGSFSDAMDKSSPKDSLFAKIIKDKKPHAIRQKGTDDTCKTCSNYEECREKCNMAYPILVDKEVMGIVSFAAFTPEQMAVMREKWDEYFNLLSKVAGMLEREIQSIKMANTLTAQKAEINEIINSIEKGIIIADSDGRITHINAKAIKILSIDLSKERVLGKRISSIIGGIKLSSTNNTNKIALWEINGEKLKFIYQVTNISFGRKNISTLINFTGLSEIIKTATSYTSYEDITFANIVGNSASLNKVMKKSKIIAPSDSSVLLQGESGTGKELFARSIHNLSLRKEGPFVPINCSAIPENLLESELFGYEHGAFTGASAQGKIGKMEQANHGTLFLDEIGDLPFHLQPKLLRAIQTREITKVGGKNPIKINIRIISATNKDLWAATKRGEFRDDLFYRINVIPLTIPPLRDRGSDALLLSEFILERLCSDMRIKTKGLSKEVKEIFLFYPWPGNIRELENVLEYAVNFSPADVITQEDLPEYITAEAGKVPGGAVLGRLSLEEMSKIHERGVLLKYLDMYGGSGEGKKTIASKLGISLATLYRKIDEHGIKEI